MKTINAPITFGRCLLAGLFAGIIASVVGIVFNVIYRGAVNLTSYEVVMPISVFTVFPLVCLIAGGFYFLFIGHIRRAPKLFGGIILLIMVAGALLTMLTWRPSLPGQKELRDLLTGMELIWGVSSAFLIPYFVNHPRLYLTDEDIRGEE